MVKSRTRIRSEEVRTGGEHVLFVEGSGEIIKESDGSYHYGTTQEVLPGGLNLGRAVIGGAHSGFFDGNVSGRLNGKEYTGKWVASSTAMVLLC